MATNGNNYKETVSAVTTAWSSLIAYNKNRTALTIYNPNAVDAYMGISEAGKVRIPPYRGMSFTADTVPLNALGGNLSSGSGDLIVWEA